LRDAPFEEIKIEVLPLSRETPGGDLRFGIVNRTANQTIASVLQRNHVAIGRLAENLKHLAGKNPVVSVQDARARFDDEAGHKVGANVQRPTLNVQRSTHRS
jgi:hypothetical protein